MPDDPLELPDLAAWEAWLAEHHAEEGGAWLRMARKRSPLRLQRASTR